MVLEILLKPNARGWNSFAVFGVGILYALIGATIAMWLFSTHIGIVMVFLTVLAAAPFMYHMIQYEEREELSFHSEKQFVSEYVRILKALLMLFIGMTIGFVIFFFFYNSYLQTTSESYDVFVSTYENEMLPTYLVGEALDNAYGSSKSPRSYDYTQYYDYRIQVINDHKQYEGFWWQSADVAVIVRLEKNANTQLRNMILYHYLEQFPPDVVQNYAGDLEERMYFFEDTTVSFTRTRDENGEFISHKQITYTIKPDVYEHQLRFMPLELDANEEGAVTFLYILDNNVGVAIACFIMSFLFGFGALFILAWNASYLATAFAGFFAKIIIYHNPLIASLLSFFRFFTHGVFEITGFFLVGLAGSILSFGLQNHEWGTKKFARTLIDALQLVLFALVLLIIGSGVEVFITPLLF